MITIEKLREFGADVDDGLSRCLNNADFYTNLVGKLTEDKTLYLLDEPSVGLHWYDLDKLIKK